jgi:rhodanese-related sulfurtransferase
MPTTITREEPYALMQTDAVTLIEALPAMQFDAGHLPGTANAPERLTHDLAARIADPTRSVVTHCSGPACSRSKATATQFERLGYTDVRVCPGGKSDWSDAGLPLVRLHATSS